MAKEYGQKYKSILVLQVLLKYTDENNPLTASEIADKLQRIQNTLQRATRNPRYFRVGELENI